MLDKVSRSWAVHFCGRPMARDGKPYSWVCRHRASSLSLSSMHNVEMSTLSNPQKSLPKNFINVIQLQGMLTNLNSCILM